MFDGVLLALIIGLHLKLVNGMPRRGASSSPKFFIHWQWNNIFSCLDTIACINCNSSALLLGFRAVVNFLHLAPTYINICDNRSRTRSRSTNCFYPFQRRSSVHAGNVDVIEYPFADRLAEWVFRTPCIGIVYAYGREIWRVTFMNVYGRGHAYCPLRHSCFFQ